MSYDTTTARATADYVALAYPCQGVRVFPHPTVDTWVQITFGFGLWREMSATEAVDLMKQLRAKQRGGRKKRDDQRE